MSICRKKKSVNVGIEARNLLSEKLHYEHCEHYNRTWNRFVGSIWTAWLPISDATIQPVATTHKLPSRFVEIVNLDIVMACLELEYADLIPPRYFKDRLDWYLAGHFPCGWDGEFPEGRLIVF